MADKVSCLNLPALSKTPLISIVIPAFNATRVIGETLESVRNQTFQNFEAIIVDNGSTDETTRLAAKFPLADPRVKFSFEPALAFCSTPR